VALSAGTLAALLSQNAAPATVPMVLATTTVRCALQCALGSAAASGASTASVALMKGVVQAMFLSKVKVGVASILIVSAVAGGTSTYLGRAQTSGDPAGKTTQAGAGKDTDSKARPDPQEHTWLANQEARRAALVAQRDAFKEQANARVREYLDGKGTLDVTLEALRNLTDAERQYLGETGQESIRMWEGIIDSLNKMAAVAKERKATQDDERRLLAMLAGAYNDLLQVKTQAATQAAQDEYYAKEWLRVRAELAAGTRKQLRELLKAQRDAAKVEAQARMQEFQAGRGMLNIGLDAHRRLLQAELEYVESKEDRVNARVAYLEAMMLMFNVIKTRYEAGKISIADLKESEYYRLEAEINLLRERNR
jgi:hypothetical protein